MSTAVEKKSAGTHLTSGGTEEAAILALALYPFGPEASLEFVTHRENCVYRVTDSTGSYALRLHRPGYRTETELCSEAAFVIGLTSEGIPVAQFLTANSGEHITTVCTSGGQQFYVDVQHWLENTGPLGDIESGFDGTSTLQPADFAEIGALTARLHEAASRLTRPVDFVRRAWDAEGLLGPTAVLGDPFTLPGVPAGDYKLLRAASDHVCKVLASMGKDPAIYGPLHGDITPENLLLTPDGLVLVDFDDCGEGWHLFDLATTLLFFVPHPRYQEYRRAAVDGYTTIRSMPAAVWEHLDAFIFARGMTYIGWAATRPEAGLVNFVRGALLPLLLEQARTLTLHTVPR